MGGCGSTEDNAAMAADLERVTREKRQKEKVAREKRQKEIALEEERIAREEEERARREATIGLTVQREDGQPEVEVEVRPWEPVHGSLDKALELDATRYRLTEAWLGQLRLDSNGSWESQGVVDGAAVRAVVEKIPLILVADANNQRVQVLRLEDGSHVGTIVGGGLTFGQHALIDFALYGPGQFDYPSGVAVDGQGRLIVADTFRNRVQVLRLEDGSHVQSIGSKGSEPGQFNQPSAVAVDEEGHVVVADKNNHRVQVFRLEDGSHVRTIGSKGEGPGQFKNPWGVAVDGQGHLIVADYYNHRVQVLRLEDGSHVATIGSSGSGPGQFIHPQGVAVDREGHLIVADTDNHRVQVFQLEDGSHVRSIGSNHLNQFTGNRRPISGSGPGQFKNPQGVAVDGQGHLIVADSGNDRVQVLRLEDGSHVRTIGSDAGWIVEEARPGQFKHPYGVAVVYN